MSNGNITRSRSYTYGTNEQVATRTLPAGMVDSNSVDYGPDMQRVTSEMHRTYQKLYEKFYWDDYEEKVVTDHLGSVTALYNSSGTKVLAAVYDAWGRRTQTSGTLEFRRGYTGHEHIDGYDLINMNSAIEREHGEFYSPVPSVSRMGEANGRVYDPLIGRFLSPDMYVQLPGFSQSFNRYSYCLNNPLKYTDPSGEKLSWHSFFSYLLISPIVPPGTAEAFLSQSLGTASNAALAGAIAGAIKGANIWDEAMLKAKNSFLIDFGLFQVNENLPPSLNMLLLTSRFTGELRQTIDGNTIAHIRNVIDRVSDVSYSNGSTLVNISYSSNSSWGFTLGPYINSKNLEADLSSELIFRHEYGHTIQSALLGPGYINFVGIPSLIGEIFAKKNGDSFLKNPTVVNDHMKEWYETQANRFSDIYCESFGYSISDDNMTKRWDEQYYKDYRLSWFWFTFSPPLPFFWRIGYLR